METKKVNSGIRELLCMEKYKFLPHGLVREIVRDFLKAIDKEEEEN